MVSSSGGMSSLRISIVSFSEDAQKLTSTISSAVNAIRRIDHNELRRNTKIVVVNNRHHSHFFSKTTHELASKFSDIDIDLEVIEGHGNIGFGRAHNLTISSCPKGYHLFLNPDVEVSEDAIAVGLAFLEEHPKVGIVSPNTINAEGEKQYLCKRFPSVFDLFLRGFLPERVKDLFSSRLSRYEMRDLMENRPTFGIAIVGGCFMLCRNQAILNIGGFDPRFFLYFEDFDLSLRVGRRFDIAYLPNMKIRHFGGNASKKGLWHIFLFATSGARFFFRHGWRWF